MIPQGRPTMTEDDIATATGLPLHTWRRRHGTDFRARVPVINPGERMRLYDETQATAYINGRPLPALPAQAPARTRPPATSPPAPNATAAPGGPVTSRKPASRPETNATTTPADSPETPATAHPAPATTLASPKSSN